MVDPIVWWVTGPSSETVRRRLRGRLDPSSDFVPSWSRRGVASRRLVAPEHASDDVPWEVDERADVVAAVRGGVVVVDGAQGPRTRRLIDAFAAEGVPVAAYVERRPAPDDPSWSCDVILCSSPALTHELRAACARDVRLVPDGPVRRPVEPVAPSPGVVRLAWVGDRALWPSLTPLRRALNEWPELAPFELLTVSDHVEADLPGDDASLEALLATSDVGVVCGEAGPDRRAAWFLAHGIPVVSVVDPRDRLGVGWRDGLLALREAPQRTLRARRHARRLGIVDTHDLDAAGDAWLSVLDPLLAVAGPSSPHALRASGRSRCRARRRSARAAASTPIAPVVTSSTGARSPAVSVLICVHDGERHVAQAVDSILAQTFEDFELVVVDDGSTDATPQILAGYDDPRVVVVRHDENRGIPCATQRGLRVARADLVARLDADDVAEPTRLERQFDVLSRRPDVAVLASSTTEIDADGRVLPSRSRLCSREGHLLFDLCRRNEIYPSAVMLRRRVLLDAGGYDEAFPYAEDHDSWVRCLQHGHRIAVLPERLTRYRRSAGQVTVRHAADVERCSSRVRQRYVQWLLGERIRSSSVDAVRALMRRDAWDTVDDAQGGLELLVRLAMTVGRRVDGPSRRAIRADVAATLLHHVCALRHSGADRRRAWLLLQATLRVRPTALLETAWWRRLVGTFVPHRPSSAELAGGRDVG